MRGDFDEDEDEDADEILAFTQALLGEMPDWTIEAWQRDQLEQELTILAQNKRRPTKRASRKRQKNKSTLRA